MNVAALKLTNCVFLGTWHFFSGLGPSVGVPKQRLKLLGRWDYYFRKSRVGKRSMPHLSPPAPKDCTVTRKTNELSTHPVLQKSWRKPTGIPGHSRGGPVAPNTNLRASLSPWWALGFQGHILLLPKSMWQEIRDTPAAAHGWLTEVAWLLLTG